MSVLTITIGSRQRTLFALVFSWTLFVATVAYNFNDLRTIYIGSFGSDSQVSELKVEQAAHDLNILVHSFNRAVTKSDTSEFIVALKSFHRLNNNLLHLSATAGLIQNTNLEQKVKIIAQQTFTHFIRPFNQIIQKLDAGTNNGVRRAAISNFVTDYEDFQLLYQGPLKLGSIEPLRSEVSGI